MEKSTEEVKRHVVDWKIYLQSIANERHNSKYTSNS